MKKFVCAMAVLLVLCMLLSVFAACKQEEADQLVIYNWADYIFDEDLEDFEQYYFEVTGKKIETIYVTFDTNETMLTRLTKGDSNVDVVCPSEYAIQKLIEMDMLLPMHYFDEAQYTASFSSVRRTPSDDDKQWYEHYSSNVDENIIQKVSETFGEIDVNGSKVSMLDYFVPYMYGTLGILYNKYAFDEAGIYDEETLNTANWGILFNDSGKRDAEGNVIPLSDALSGNILMKDSIRDSYAATVFYLKESGRLDGLRNGDGVLYTDMPVGELINAVDDTLLKAFEEALTDQKSQLFGYEVDFGKDDLLTGNAMVDLAWSGDAMYAVEESWSDELEDYELGYYLPHDTGNIWFDGWVVPKKKSYEPAKLDAIKLFINYLNRPDNAARNLLEIGYSAAIDPEVLRNDESAKAVLAEGYAVYAPELWSVTDENGAPIPQEECDFADWEEFEQYFFDNSYTEEGETLCYDEIGGANWRYPFTTEASGDYNRDWQTTLGVMRDFGDKNHDVVTAWNYARSAGVTAWPLLGWTALAVAVAVGAVFLVIWIKRTLRHKEKLDK